MAKIVFIIGGARSGKSAFALQKAKERKGRVAFIATCVPGDDEMKKRIAVHKASRPKKWITFETTLEINEALAKMDVPFKTVLIDCLTLWISNLMLHKETPRAIEKKTLNLLATLKKMKTRVILVSNEVGLGIVPGNRLARDFRDIAGRVNQIVAQHAAEAYFMVSGIPVRIK